ncbi:hypothetical protein GCM10007416_35670 [Kroppenstedtia guangzhouensis]|uniref:Uncharacterized protein n=1 Tax=Kroppenstedtia guangzhouensis TaxID=1274356 RepID=A0ABQ1H5G6_9BACL|nr:hypothetical protein [Kroppenstedtia guangzhouensis]GGA59483.1 hypothetical protein GCM10007416_35670 [Kroppenstedtia guangzhouensis]
MEITVTIDVEERLKEMLKEAELESEEIKKILNGFSEWLQEVDPGAVSDAAEHYLEDLSECVRRAPCFSGTFSNTLSRVSYSIKRNNKRHFIRSKRED